MSEWKLANSEPSKQSVTQDWQFVQPLIDGVIVQEMRNVPTGYGYLTEIYRMDWNLESLGVDQVFQAVVNSGAVSAWHAHETTTDRLFCGIRATKACSIRCAPGFSDLRNAKRVRDRYSETGDGHYST